MPNITFWGDFKLIKSDNLSLDNGVQNLLKNAELNIVNFEAPVKTPSCKPVEKTGPNHFQPFSAPSWLESHGWNIISIANNHFFDFGEEACQMTIDSFKKAETIGGGDWDEAYKVKTYTLSNGIRIGLLALTHCEFGTLTSSHSQSNVIGSAWVLHPSVPSLIINAKNKVDYLFLYIHAGIEEVDLPLPEWREIFKNYIELGCDAIIASHPHIPMGWEYYRKKPIFYSLGNLCFQKESIMQERWYQSLCIKVVIEKNVQFEIVPVIYDYINDEIKIYDGNNLLKSLEDLNLILNDEERYLQYIDNICVKLLPTYEKLFECSGYLKSLSCFEIARKIKRIFSKRPYSMAPLLNNLQCESHRWAICRAVRSLNKIR